MHCHGDNHDNASSHLHTLGKPDANQLGRNDAAHVDDNARNFLQRR